MEKIIKLAKSKKWKIERSRKSLPYRPHIVYDILKMRRRPGKGYFEVGTHDGIHYFYNWGTDGKTPWNHSRTEKTADFDWYQFSEDELVESLSRHSNYEEAEK